MSADQMRVRTSGTHVLLLAALGYQHRQFERLLVVKPWVNLRTVSPLQIGVGQAARAPRALGDVFAG